MKNKQMLFLFTASVILIVYSFAVLNSQFSDIVSIPLPIAIHGYFPIPVLFWAGVIFYAAATSFITGNHAPAGYKRWFAFGLLLHLMFMLLKMKFQMIDEHHIVLVSAYKLYYDTYISGVLMYVAWYCGTRLYSINAFSLPFIVSFILIEVLLTSRAFYIQAVCILATFCAAAYIHRAQTILIKLRAWSTRFWQFILAEKVFLTLIFLGALGVRIFYLSRIMSNPEYLTTGSDATWYDTLARSFARGDKVTEPLVAGYWMFLALIYKIVGTGYSIVGLIQSLLSCFSCIFIFYAGKYLFNIKTARIGAVLSVVSYPLIFASVGIGHQALDVFLSTTALVLLSRYVRLDAKKKYSFELLALSGITLGLSIATREVNFFYPVMIISWLFVDLRKKAGFKSASLSVVVLSCCVILALAPFIVRNIRNLGVWYPISATSGASYPVVEGYLKGENLELVKAGLDLSDPGKVLRTMVRKPVHISRVYFIHFTKKIQALYFNQDIGSFDIVFLSRLSPYYYAAWFYAYVITIVGVIAAFKKYKLGAHVIAFFFILNRTMVHMVTESQYRHRAPIEPFLILYFAFGFYYLLCKRKQDECRDVFKGGGHGY